MKYADLHIHTDCSDGAFSPGQIITLANNSGLNCISITDHDSINAHLALDSFGFGYGFVYRKTNHCPLAYLESQTIALPAYEDTEVIPGIELTAGFNNSEVHILGYFVDYREAWFQEKLESLRQLRIQRMAEMCRKLKNLNVGVDLEEVLNLAGNGSVGRAHLARVMVKKGYVKNVPGAFGKYIDDDGPAYVSKFRLTLPEVISIINKAGGIAVLAHPHSLNNEKLIPLLAQAGLRGLEVFYPEYSSLQIEHYQRLAEEHGLLMTGGSDYHGGQIKPETKLGIIKIPYSLVDELKRLRKSQ